MIFNEMLASSRAAEYEKILRHAVEFDRDYETGGKVVQFARQAVWPHYVLEKNEAYEFIPDDLKGVYEIS